MKPLPFKMIQETDMEKYRAETFWTKEPETIEWIDSFKPGEIFFDVGANIGVYSLYAASRGIGVCAFEPYSNNYNRLMENVELNNWEHQIFCYDFALGNKDEEEMFFLPQVGIAVSGGQVGDSIDEHHHRFESVEIEHIFCHKLDTVIKEFKVFPHHIKIDVDGREDDILTGMRDCLKSSILKSVLIECNGGEIANANTIYEFDQWGFTNDNPLNSHPNHSRIRRQKEGITAENIIFTRKEA